jgi:hypothetical protein
MQIDLLDQIRAIDPLPEDLQAPPLQALLAGRERGSRDPTVVSGPRRLLPRRRNLLVLPLAAVIFAIALLGEGGSRKFDVAAAVYRATIAGSGVHYMVLEGEAGPHRIRYERWSTTDPVRERDVLTERSQTVELVNGVGFGSAWSSAHPHQISRVHHSTPVSRWDPVLAIQKAYRAGRLRVLGKTHVGSRAAYRAEVVPQSGGSRAIVIVDAHTYMPIEMLYYGHDAGEGAAPILVVHVRSYEQLPATSANLALLRIAHHAGARVVETTPARPR